MILGRARVALFVWCALLVGVSARVVQADGTHAQAERPRLYLSCPQECFESYLRQELSYFDFVRDPHLSDINLVVVRQAAGSGGERFTITPSSRIGTTSVRSTSPRVILVDPATPAADARAQLLQGILRVLASQLDDTEHSKAFELRLPTRDGDRLSRLIDAWNYWVIAPELRGGGEGGSGYYFIELAGALTVRRITDQNKLRLSGYYARNLSGYRLEDGSRISGDVYEGDLRALYAHALGQHVSLGGVVVARVQEYENLKHHAHGGPVIELNLFRFEHNAQRQLRLAYQVGAWANTYLEPAVGDVMSHVRAYHAVSIITDVNLAWGSVQVVGQLNTFVPDVDQFRFAVGANLTLRLFEGFAFTLSGSAAWVNDLINLRARDVTDNELLLWTAQQPTDYTFQGTFALTYTFGSVHNTIVNPRFGRLDLEEE